MATFKMQLNELEETLLSIEAFLKNVDEKSKYKIMFICEELLTNLVRHANFKDKTPDITFNIEVGKNNTFELQCRDNAQAFNLLEYKQPDFNADLEDKELGGLGIYLLQKYTKKMEYFYEKGFNILRIIL